jgi:MFS family permease
MEAGTPMTDPRRRNLLLICLASAAWAFGFGVGSQLVSHWMNAQDASKELIGWNHSCYYFGLAMASLGVPWMSRRLGPRGAALGMLVCGPTLALFPWVGPVGWFVLRLVNGAASALSLIPLEAMVSREAPAGQRARDFAFYGVAITLGGALGMWGALQLVEWDALLAFYAGSALPMLGGLALLFWLPTRAAHDTETAGPIQFDWRRHFLSFGTAWSQGFLEGGMVAFLALYMESRGFSADVAGDLMGVTTIGVLLAQVPVSWLADRHGRIPVLLGCYAVVLAGLALAPICPGSIALAICLFAFGASAGAMYPLGLALLGDGLPESSLARVYSWYLAMECLGSLMGPPAMGMAIDALGGWSMFAVGFAAVAIVLTTWAIVRRRCTAVVQPVRNVDQRRVA